jgi:septum formation protein
MRVAQDAIVTLVLASGSPRRRDLIAEMGYLADIHPAEVDEWNATDEDPAEVVLHNALLKADWVSARYPDRPVLGSDTAVAFGAELLHKPVDMDEARAMLTRLSGQTHVVHTGVSLQWRERGLKTDFVETSRVVFKAFDADVIERYFSIVNPLDKAGAYGIQHGRELILEKWEGSFHNIMGLPTERLEATFERLGWNTCLTRL